LLVVDPAVLPEVSDADIAIRRCQHHRFRDAHSMVADASADCCNAVATPGDL
jgi:hypothetical protein